MKERKTANRDTDEKRKANHDYDSINKGEGELDLRNSNVFFPPLLINTGFKQSTPS